MLSGIQKAQGSLADQSHPLEVMRIPRRGWST